MTLSQASEQLQARFAPAVSAPVEFRGEFTVTVNREQIAATAASRIAQETTATVEQEKFRVGKSTSLLVAQAQRDLLTAQIAEVQAVVNHLKALTALYRLEGSLLTRRFISAPALNFNFL